MKYVKVKLEGEGKGKKGKQKTGAARGGGEGEKEYNFAKGPRTAPSPAGPTSKKGWERGWEWEDLLSGGRGPSV